MSNEERIKEAKQTVIDFNNLLIKKGNIFLEIEIKTIEEADEIGRWMYSKKDSPMKSNLIQVAWDKTLVPKELRKAIEIIQKTTLI